MYGSHGPAYAPTYSAPRYRNAYTLETIVSDSPVHASRETPVPWYTSDRYRRDSDEQYTSRSQQAQFDPDAFLAPSRLPSIFVNASEQVQEIMREAFRKTAGQEFPDNLAIAICPPHEMRRLHEHSGGTWDSGIMGFCINRNGRGRTDIVVKEDHLDRLLITLGHEIGHAMSLTLPDEHDEEAKAFAFSLAWMDTIVLHNIGGLSSAVNPRPAQNGLHNVAFDFVIGRVRAGDDPLALFGRLARGETHVKHAAAPIILI